MGNVSSRPEEGAALYLREQSRLSITSLAITNSRRRVLLGVSPNAYPATKVIAHRDVGDDSHVEYIQDVEASVVSPSPSFILRLNNDDDLNFNFTFVIRQGQSGLQGINSPVDTFVNGLTFAFASNTKDLDNLVTREFHADPNLHKNSNVELVGDYSTGGSPSVQFEWSWKWRPPKITEDRGGGWRNTCSFVEYDQRAHRLTTLATFHFWVQNTQRVFNSPSLPSPTFEMLVPPRLRVTSAQSVQSQSGVSDFEGFNEVREAPSPVEPQDNSLAIAQNSTPSAVTVDVSCGRPRDDMGGWDDGPLFRATMKALEQKTGNMRARMKKVLRKAEAAQVAQVECNDAVTGFMTALREAATSNANAIQPALEHYFEKIAQQILLYERQNTVNLQKLIIEPLSRLYNFDIKQAEAKKKDFEEESRDYYAYVSRYLGQRQDSLKEKKRIESDTKYQSKRRNFELKRFDYSSFMQDLHGGRKEQEVLSQLTKYAETQAKSYLSTAKVVEEMTPQLEALIREVKEADKEYRLHRTEREEKRRTLEKSTNTYFEPEGGPGGLNPVMPASIGSNGAPATDSELSRGDSNGRNNTNGRNSLHHQSSSSSQHGPTLFAPLSSNGIFASTGSRSSSGNPGINLTPDRFKGIRDLEEKDYTTIAVTNKEPGQHRKEGLLWALSRPGSHADPKGLNKQAWHKFWIVLDQGKLSEYSNWKQRLDLHMEPIDLRMASVREARNSERRFCLEVITPHFKRVYQATSEEDMNSWINAINNALQSAVEGRSRPLTFTPSPTSERNGHRDIGNVLTGKSSSVGHLHHHHQHTSSHITTAAGNNVFRRITVGARPTYVRGESSGFDDDPSKLLQIVRDTDQGNCWCADCGSGIKTEWVSINLGIVLCIECSGIHRSLGTHISKVRSLTLDTTSFTTDIVELLLQIGNRVSNMVWEARLDQSMKPQPQATREQRLRFITAKYVERAYVTPISSTQSHFNTADDTLLASIKKNDIQGVLYALALRANPNAHDRSRNTHTIFLALAAADPASPAGVTSNTSSPRCVSSPTGNKVIAFPIAELLVQNGAEIPTTMPAFPLSPLAQLYIDQRSGRDAGGDTLGALPVLNGSPADKDRERLQKRISAGARLPTRLVGN